MRLMYAAAPPRPARPEKRPSSRSTSTSENQARAGLPAALHDEFDALFPSAESRAPIGVERLSALAGYLEGMVQDATLRRRIAAEAEARERQVETRRADRARAEDAEAAARAEDEGYPLGREAEGGRDDRARQG